uniref:Fibroblast growth factor n=1 Tax=Sinocyclocheilus anshuiensis TaxID=1608454 RepID=A0A671QHC7_9TELE
MLLTDNLPTIALCKHPLHGPRPDVKVKAVKAGIVAIMGHETGLYLAMDKYCGELYGTVMLNDECCFIEKIEENHYNTYRSQKYQENGDCGDQKQWTDEKRLQNTQNKTHKNLACCQSQNECKTCPPVCIQKSTANTSIKSE